MHISWICSHFSANITTDDEELSANQLIAMSESIITAVQLGQFKEILNTTAELSVSVIEPLPSSNDSAWTVVAEVMDKKCLNLIVFPDLCSLLLNPHTFMPDMVRDH